MTNLLFANIALVTEHGPVVFMDQTVHHPGVMHFARRHTGGVNVISISFFGFLRPYNRDRLPS